MKRNIKSWFYPAAILVLVLASLLGFAGTARAAEFIDGGTIPADQVIDDDVFIAGDNVVVDGTVNGDLFASGATVTINGIVRGSLFAGAQTIVMNGKVEGSLYAGSSSLVLGEEAEIGRNLFYGGFGLAAKPGSHVDRDLVAGVYQAQLNGEIGRDVLAGLGALELGGTVGGDVKLDIGEPAPGGMPSFFAPPGAPAMISPGLRVAEDAKIGGELIYTSVVDQGNQIEAAPQGGVVYQTPVPGADTPSVSPRVRVELRVGEWILARMRELVTLLALGGLAAWLIPALMGRWVERVRTAPLPAAGWGLVTLILGYAGAAVLVALILAVGIFLSVVTLGGLASSVFGMGFSSLSLAFTLFSLFVSYGSKLVVSFLLGKLILAKLAPQVAEHRAWPMIVGVVVYVLLRSIPILGWVIGVLVTFVGLGAVYLVYRDERRPSLPVAA